jgi:protein kinase C substrate 80K-H
MLREFRVFLVDNGILAATPSDGNEAPAVTEARSRVTEAENSLNNQRTELDKHKTDLDAEYGTDGVFRALKGRCVSRDSGEYTYELCWMYRTTQKPKKGGGDTGMGNFVRFDTITVDDELPADGRGLGSGVRHVMKFENGQHCWNGPSRSTTVVMACAETDEIWKIAEEEKCVYRMEVGTPAVCENGSGQQQPKRDEL